jgi:HK97 family phage major capsid protein
MIDLDEIKSLVEQTGDAFDIFKKSNDAKLSKLADRLDGERREREDLELRMSKLGTGRSAATGAANLERKALASFVRTGDDSELKAMSVGSDPDGGYLVLPAMSQNMLVKPFPQGALGRLARRITMPSGNIFEEVVDNKEAGATWASETQARTETTSPQLGKISIPLDEIYATVPVTQRLIDDAAFDVGGWIEGKISDKFERSEAAAFVSGDGVGKPRGLLTYPTATTDDSTRPFGTIQHIVSGAASSFGSTVATQADKLVDLVYSLRGPYRAGASWLMNSNTLNVIRKFKVDNSTGQYSWITSMQEGGGQALLGYPIEVDEIMPDIAADSFPIAFGNWQASYYVVDRPGVRFMRDPYTSKPAIVFYAYRRIGGALANSEAVKLLKIST